MSGDLLVIEQFVKEVCDRAESRMVITGKLEGAHYAAMLSILAERRSREPVQVDNSTQQAKPATAE